MVAKRMLPNGRASSDGDAAPSQVATNPELAREAKDAPGGIADTVRYRVDATVEITDSEAEKRVGKEKWKAATSDAVKAIHEVYRGYAEVEDLLAKANKKSASLASRIHGIARHAVELAGNNLGLARSYFSALCRTAEGALQREHKTAEGRPVPMQELLPLWAVTKSQILSGFKEGLNPAEFQSTGAIREAVKQRRASRAPGGQTDQTESSAEARSNMGNRVQDMAERAQFTPRLASVLNVLVVHCKVLNEEGMDKAAGILDKAIKEIDALAKNHRRKETRPQDNGNGERPEAVMV